MSKPLIVGNWKMHLNVAESRRLAERVEQHAAEHLKKVEVLLCPGFVALSTVAAVLKKLKLGVQNLYFTDEGAFTGEVSAAQAAELAAYAIVGHSERRHIFGETNEMVARKAAAALRNRMTPIICIGETAHERQENETGQVLRDQLATSLTMLTASEAATIVIAYEPVWAIGSGDNAKPEQVSAATAEIRGTVAEMFGAKTAATVRILYGGSVNTASAGSYLDLKGVDGLLVGGASLDDEAFTKIVKRAYDGRK